MKPLTRKEMLLDGAAKGNLDTFKPATREEVFAKRALTNAGGSGGGVFYVDFVCDKASWDGVSDFYAECQAQKTFAEIETAYKNGLTVVARETYLRPNSDRVQYYLYPLDSIDGASEAGVPKCAFFTGLQVSSDGVYQPGLNIMDDGRVAFSIYVCTFNS